MKRKGTLYSALLLIVMFGLPVTASAEVNIATVDVDKLFDNYSKTVELNEKLETDIQSKQAERDVFVDDIRRMKDEIVLLADANKRDQQREIDQKIQDLQQFDEQTRTELADKRNEFMRDILVELNEKIKAFGNKKGYDLILNNKLLLFGKEEYDITEDLLKALNE